jgi:hypothetical protein
MDAEEPSFLGDIWQGFVTPSLGSCLGAFAFVVLELAFCCIYITPERLARIDPKLLMEGPDDDYANITVKALRLHFGTTPGLGVAYLGASSARQALLNSESPATIEGYLASEIGEKTTFYFLSGDAESMVDGIALSEQLPRGFRGVVVFMVSDYRDEEREIAFQKKDRLRAGSRLALYAPEADRADHTPAKRSGIYFLDFFPFFAMRRAAAARIDRSLPKAPLPAPSALTPAQQMAWEMWSAPTWLRVRDDLASRDKLAILHRDEPVLESLVATWKKNGLTGILLEAPDNPRFDSMKEGLHEVYKDEIPRLAARLGVEYWDLNPEIGLVPTDFADHVHLVNRGARFRFQAAFVKRLAAFMKPMARPAQTIVSPRVGNHETSD